MSDCVVTGGGISGMAAALLLAGEGRKVRLIEKAARPGPLLRGFSRGGVHFETGFHFAGGLERGGVLRRWLLTLGLDLPLDSCPDETERVITAAGTYVLPVGEEGLLEWTGRLFPGSLPAMRILLDDCRAVHENTPFLSVSGRLSHTPAAFAERRATDYLSAIGMEDEPARVLLARCLLYGISPAEASRDEFFLVTGAYLRSSRTVPGGGPAIVAAFERALERAGVDVRCGLAVTGIAVGDGRVRRVLLEDGTGFDTDTLVFTGHPGQLKDLLPKGAMRPAWHRHVDAMEETAEPVLLCGTADETVPELGFWYFPPEDGRLVMIEDEGFSFGFMTGPALPDGTKSCMVCAMSGAGTRGAGTAEGRGIHLARKAAWQERLALRAERSLPMLGGHWRQVELVTGQAMRRWLHGSTGSCYGFAHNMGSLPLPPVTKVGGLFLAGQNILLPGVLGCIVSSAVAASFALGNDNILNRFRSCANAE
ncbi:MAG: FAD-dependent oxidoreductase [Desulfovibrionaceae bacterium]|nr:FAD-dependent oxidoreductase [Desulfovibrionaceae bacterium]